MVDEGLLLPDGVPDTMPPPPMLDEADDPVVAPNDVASFDDVV